MKRNNNNNNKRRRRRGPNGRRGNFDNMQNSCQVVSLMSRPVRKQINISAPIYACYCSDGTSAYSFFGTTSSGSLSRAYDISGNFTTTKEYTDMIKAFQFIRILGLKIRVVSSHSNNTQVLAQSPYFLQPWLSGVTTTLQTAAYSDISMEVMPANNARVYQRYYRFPGTVVGASGYALGGSSQYLPAWQYASSTGLNLLLGQLVAPDLSSVNFHKISVVDIILDVEFSCPWTQ